jgi:signal transduction histidine kinase/pSer/pThr/pTyr-binding forkhead associated (FHA) protein
LKDGNSNNSKAYLIPYPVESFSKPVLIGPECTYVGRDPNGGIQITNEIVSRQHARIHCTNGHFFIEDLSSQNGTFLNNQRVQKEKLRNHDKITFGNRTFLFLEQSDSLSDLLFNPAVSATDTIAISKEEIDLSNLWAQSTEYAAREFIQPIAGEPTPDTIEPNLLAHARLSMLYQLSDSLRTINDVDQIYAKGLDLIMEAIPAAYCALIALKSEYDESFRIDCHRFRDKNHPDNESIPISRTLFDWVLTERVTLFSRNASEDLRFEDSDSIQIQNLRSIVCVPITSKNRVNGLLYAQSLSFIDPITKEDAAFASAVANELALTIDNHRLKTEVVRNERMAAIGLTVSNLAHNIKNMIALTQNAAQLLEGRIAKLEQPHIEKHWLWLQQGLTGISRLSSEILEYVKEDQLLLKPTDVNRLILKYRKSIEGSLSRPDVNVQFTLSNENPVWTMDEVQFLRALFNLILNAADAVKEKKGGRVRISTSLNKNGCLVVGVSDNGCGISPQKIPKVLELFFTTKGTRGTGLGLPMVQKFVEKSGGKLRFNSKENIGSIFQMIFPKSMA